MAKKKKMTLEALQKFLGQEGKSEISGTKGELSYVFACPHCKEIGHDSDGNHLRFYPERSGFIKCFLRDKSIESNEHGIKIYNQVIEFLEKEKFTSNLLELINYFGFEPMIKSPYAYFGCEHSEIEDKHFCSRFVRFHLGSGEIRCIDPDSSEELEMPYCCSILSGLREFRELNKTEGKNG